MEIRWRGDGEMKLHAGERDDTVEREDVVLQYDFLLALTRLDIV